MVFVTDVVYGKQANDIKKSAQSNNVDQLEKYLSSRRALMSFAEKGDIEAVKFLVSKGANVNAKDKSGKTVLSWFGGLDDIEVAKFLVSKGAK